MPRAYSNQPFMSSPQKQSGFEQPTASISMKWEDVFVERTMQWLPNEGGDIKWGWVVYRSCYRPEFDTA
jgi:hypothetical protein